MGLALLRQCLRLPHQLPAQQSVGLSPLHRLVKLCPLTMQLAQGLSKDLGRLLGLATRLPNLRKLGRGLSQLCQVLLPLLPELG